MHDGHPKAMKTMSTVGSELCLRYKVKLMNRIVLDILNMQLGGFEKSMTIALLAIYWSG